MQVVPESRSARADRLRPLVRAQVDALGSAAAVGRAAGESPATVRFLVAGAPPPGGNLDAPRGMAGDSPAGGRPGGHSPGDAEDGLGGREFAAAFQAWVEERVGTGPYRPSRTCWWPPNVHWGSRRRSPQGITIGTRRRRCARARASNPSINSTEARAFPRRKQPRCCGPADILPVRRSPHAGAAAMGPVGCAPDAACDQESEWAR